MSYYQKALERLRTAKADLQAIYPIERLALFGSVSRKEDDENSDVDILVEFNK